MPTFVQILDFIGTFAFAISGIRLASAKRFDWFGAYVVGLATAIGGGTIRDVLLDVTPGWMTDPIYLICTGLALLWVICFGRWLIRLNNTFFIFDTIGLALFTVVGFYPVCPGTDEYVLGTPYFKEMKLHLENGKTVTISAPNNGDDKRYISSMTLNGKEYTKNYLTHQDLLNGASISYKMDAKPNQQRGTKESDFPYSFSNEFKKKK